MKLMKTQGASDAMQMAHYKLTIIIIIIIILDLFLNNDGKSNSRYVSCLETQLAQPQSVPGSRRYINGLSAPDAHAYGAI